MIQIGVLNNALRFVVRSLLKNKTQIGPYSIFIVVVVVVFYFLGEQVGKSVVELSIEQFLARRKNPCVRPWPIS